MKTWVARSGSYAVVAMLAAAALRFTPAVDAPAPGRLLVEPPSPAVQALIQHTDTLARGETIVGVLSRSGVSEVIAREALAAAKMLDPRKVPAGMPITFSSTAQDSVPSEIVFHLAVDHLVKLTRTNGVWVGDEQRLPWTTDTLTVAGRISSTLYEALDSAAANVLPGAARAELAWTLADIYEYRIDMSRDLQVGDEFRMVVERERGPNGAVRVGNILAASFTNDGSTVEAVRFHSSSVGGDYFDADGKSLRASFLRAPLSFRRISSVFGMRRHPILGIVRGHMGTDYAANAGTPVRAVGDATVIFAGRKGGYGNMVILRHRNGYITRHGHLRGFAKGIRAGKHVAIGETIGYVGTTGLSTGPHLHFEVIVNGVQKDPRVALRVKGGDPIPGGERRRFLAQRDEMVALLDRTPDVQQLALR
ncbi:MAG TPA: M23 family metallopeptidase [Gemmatimonadaceae bacterium]|nr:M23 family metallopeptidase [Gemmatimonadaceae bacterium]